MTTPLTVASVRRNDGEHVLVAAGEIDLSNIDAFRQALAAATDEAAGSGRSLAVDLSAVEYLDSAAISALFACADHISGLTAHTLLMSPLTISGLTELVTVEEVPQASDR